MEWSNLLPESVRARPVPIEVTLEVPAHHLPADAAARADEALRCAGVAARPADDGQMGSRPRDARTTGLGWSIELTWRTAVLGAFIRNVGEHATIQVTARPAGSRVVVRCEPTATHDAHAAGAATTLILATCSWLLAGWTTIGIPAGLTTLLAGGTLVAVTRRMALRALELRLQRLAADVATGIWGAPQAS